MTNTEVSHQSQPHHADSMRTTSGHTAPLVSIVMSCYNSEHFLEQTIASVQAQTYQNWELIAVNDCSTDRTLEMLKAAAKADSRIQVVSHEKNGGRPGITRNTALERVKGDFIRFLDHDDLYTESSTERLVDFLLRRPECLGVFADMHYVDADGRISGRFLPDFLIEAQEHLVQLSGQEFVTSDRFFLFQCLRYSAVNMQTITIARKRLGPLKLKFEPGLCIGEDKDLWIQLAMQGTIGYVNEPMAHYRLHDGNISKRALQAACDLAQLATRNRLRASHHLNSSDLQLLRHHEATAYANLGWHLRQHRRHVDAFSASRKALQLQPSARRVFEMMKAFMPARG